ncbi:unnamed protein product [Auanema sp. JU1783]|nr:unnamed protein product [Auanema sp. JU1783]
MGKNRKLKGGDFITPAGALDKQLESSKIATERSAAREKTKRRRNEDDPEFMPTDMSAKILSEARKQLQEDAMEDAVEDAEPSTENKRLRHLSLGQDNTSDIDDDLPAEDEDYDDQIIQIDAKVEEELSKFIVKKSDAPAQRTLYDLIQEKIEQKKADAECSFSTVDPNEFNFRELDPEVLEMYVQVGKLLSKYRAGKVPKAFKIIPKMVNWEQILYVTEPDKWTSAAVYVGTKLFASNLNPRMCQRFYNLVLLPRLRDDIDEFKILNFHLYKALCKAIYKPAAFFKGIILPLCESGTCTLREAMIFSSVLSKVSIPMFHAAAAMLKIAEMPYTGSNSVFLRALIDKKFALPYKAVDAVCNHFIRLKNDERDMPVLWHQCLLSFCQRYKNDLSPEQKTSIYDLIRYQGHYLISPEIRRELGSKEVDGKVVSSVPVEDKRKDTMEF